MKIGLRHVFTAALLPALLTLTACGGGGGGGGSSNSAPTVSGPISRTVDENDAAFTVSSAELLANASDADGDSLSINNLALSSGDATAVTVNTNSIDVTPNVYSSYTDGEGEDMVFTYTISDGKGGNVSTSLTLTINGVNDAPSRVALNNISLPHDTVSGGGFLVGTLYADDAENDPVTFTVTGGDDADVFAINGNRLFIDDGVLDFDNQSEYHLTVTASDGVDVDFDLTVIVLEHQVLNVGYYDSLRNNGRPEQATPITFIGETAIDIGDLNVADFSGLDMIFAQNPTSTPPTGPFAAAANQSKIADFVNDGGILIFHDRHAETIESYLPGMPGSIIQDIGATRTEFEVIDHQTHLAQGPGGVINDTNLESANSLSFGFADASTTHPDAIGYLSRNDPNHWITYAYPVGLGWVVYSSIPLDFYLLAGNPEIMRSTYAPNILAQARSLVKKGTDTDGDGLLDVEEAVFGTAIDSDDTDGDGLLDAFEIREGLDAVANDDSNSDPDNDGLTNLEEQMAGTKLRIADSDGDGLTDGAEVNTHSTDPLNPDTDGDLLDDAAEINTHNTDPLVADTDGGGTMDGREILVDLTDPLDASDDLNQIDLPLTLNDANGFIWDIQRDGNINNGSSDAYDGGMRLFIDNVQFPQFNAATSLQNGREVNLALANLSGLQISRRIYVPPTQAFVRYLDSLVNPSASDITVEVRIDTNLGSDGNTVIVRTSDGDTAIEPVDFYVVTDDTSNGGGDPSLAHVYAGPGAAVTPVVTAPLGRIIYTYSVTVPANSRATIMHFDSQNANRTIAIASADALLGLGAATLDGMSEADLQDVVNFDLTGVTATGTARKITVDTQAITIPSR